MIAQRKLGQADGPTPGALRWRVALLVSAALPFAPAVVLAQTADTGPQTIEELIVTARKRDERLVDVPASIVALGAETIENARIARIDDLGMFAPNLNISTRADSTPNVTLRGVGAFGVVEGVGFYVNDVQQFEGQAVPFDDIESIQVLRGPQGTLYGGSNIGGAIKYTTKRPTDAFSGLVKLEAGDQDTRNVTAVLSGPLTGELGARLTAYHKQNDGYIFNTTIGKTVNSQEITGGRLTLAYDRGDTRASLYLSASREEQGAFVPFYQAPNDHTYLRTVSYDNQPPIFMNRNVYSATLQIDQQLGELTLTSLSSVFYAKRRLRADLDFGPAPILYVDVEQTHNILSQELRLSSPSDQTFTWILGAFFQYRRDPDRFDFHVVPAGFTAITLGKPHGNLYALFGNATYETGPWTFEGGLRVEHDDNRLRVPVSLAGPLAEESQKTTSVLPRASVTYALSERINAYAAVTAGHTPGGLTFVNNPVFAIQHYKKETTLNFEAGLKGTLFDGRVRFDADVFYLPYDDRLFQKQVIFPGVGFVQVTSNVGESQNYGFELSADAKLTDELTLSAGFGVTEAEWKSAVVRNPNTNLDLNLKGLDTPNVPQYQASLGLDWSHPLTDDLTLGLRADASLVGAQYWNLDNSRQQRAYQIVNLSARLESRNWELSTHLANVFDEDYNTEYYRAAEVGAFTDIASVGRPRLWTVTLAMKF